MKMQARIGIKPPRDKHWIGTFKPVPKIQNFADGKYPGFLEKGTYKEPFLMASTLLRGELQYEMPFRLFFKRLRATDKNY